MKKLPDWKATKRDCDIRSPAHFPGGLCFIADTRICGLKVEEMTEAVLRAGAMCIQYREKDKSRKDIYLKALRLRRLTRKFGAMLIVNDHADIALAVDADGVHLGQDDMPLSEARKVVGDMIVGLSTHSLTEALNAAEGGADYIGFGPVFHTNTKDAGEPKGVEMLREIKMNVKIPVVAIGGITLKNLQSVLDAGADAVAVASAILRGPISENVGKFIGVINKGG